MTSQELSCGVSPTLAARRAGSTQKVLDTRVRMARSSEIPPLEPNADRAEPFIDESLTVDGVPRRRRKLWLAVSLAAVLLLGVGVSIAQLAGVFGGP